MVGKARRRMKKRFGKATGSIAGNCAAVGEGVNEKAGGMHAPGGTCAAGGKPPVPTMRDGWYMQAGTRVRLPSRCTRAVPGAFKGTQAILLERGLQVAGTLKGYCKAKAGLVEPDKPCRCKCLFANQPDFFGQKTALEELCEPNHHLALMLPKCHPGTCPGRARALWAWARAGARSGTRGRAFGAARVRVHHAAVCKACNRVALVCLCVASSCPPPSPPHLPVAELNPIERFWAAVKDHLRQVCGYTGPDLAKNVPEAVRAVPLQQVQRYFRHAERFEHLCRFEHEQGLLLTGPVRDYAMTIPYHTMP